MISFTYTKRVNMRVLQNQLLAAGFLVSGLIQHHDTWQLIVNLEDAETKDPTAIVNAHVYVEDLQPDLKQAYTAIRNKYQEAVTAITAATNVSQLKQALVPLGACLKWTGRVIAFTTGAIDLDDAEYLSGELNLDK